MDRKVKQPSLFAAIAIGVGCIIGSGWLFAAYYAAKFTGGLSLLSWIIGAFLALLLAFMLSEIATMYPNARGLYSRVMTISHNRDCGFVIAISNWLGLVITIPSEAEATVQYLSSAVPRIEPYIFFQHHLTPLGIFVVCLFILLYGLLNFWGIKTLTKANNLITVFKILIPCATAIILISYSFHPHNFIAYKNSFAPYGIAQAFTAVVTCGIFYAFYGFGTIASFISELKNPRRNIPIALISSVLICLVIYLLLQVAFIGALPTHLIVKSGWHNILFTSPLAQLLILLNINFWAVILYIDSFVSPSGTGTLYSGSGARSFTAMAQEKQMPSFFAKVHPVHNFSHRSLAFTLLLCFCLVVFFRNWQKIMIVVTVFQLLTCMAVSVAFLKLRYTQPDKVRAFKVKFAHVVSFAVFVIVAYLLSQAGIKALLLSLVLHFALFTIYTFTFYRGNMKSVAQAFASAWSVFFYLVYSTLFGYLNEIHLLFKPMVLVLFFLATVFAYVVMLKQKNYLLE